jgi:protein TonB
MRSRELTILGSLALHGVIAYAALQVAHEKKVRRATTVAIADQKKKEEPKKPEPPKPPPPKPKPAAPKPAAAPAPEPAAATAPAPASSAPLATDIAMGNETGMDMGTGARSHEETKAAPIERKPKPAAAPTDKPLHVDAPPPAESSAGACTEPPGKPVPTLKTDIEYTEEARAAGVQGRLVLEVTVDADGNVSDVKVVHGVDAALDAAAIATVKTWRFKPALACGKPVAGGVYRIARSFELGD